MKFTVVIVERVSAKMKMDKPNQISICPLWCTESRFKSGHILAKALNKKPKQFMFRLLCPRKESNLHTLANVPIFNRDASTNCAKKNLHKMKILCVPTKGIEPSHPCEWQILSLLRLPIPPHGQKLICAAILRYPSILSKIRCRYFFL